MNIVALLTGRGNNTLKDKNILEVLGKPLLLYPAMAAKNSKYITDWYVSSDDEKILNIAYEAGYKKILRPAALATPDAKHMDAILHALDVIKEKDGIEADILLVFLANSPTVKTEWIDQAIEQIKTDPTISSVVPVYQEQDHHPFRAKRLNNDGLLDTFFDFTGKEVSSNRQELEPCFFLCHNFWVMNMKNSIYYKGGQKPWTFLGDNIKPIIVEECFDVHTKEDLKKSAVWLKNNLV